MTTIFPGVTQRLIRVIASIWIAITSTGAIAQGASAPITGSFSGLVFNRATQTFNSILTLTNTGTLPIQSPITIGISTGTTAITVAGTPDGVTYSANLTGGSLAAGASAQQVVAFVDPKRVTFSPRITSFGVTVTVAQQTITSAQGGTISITGAGNPLNGTQVIIPPGALGDPTDTITVGYSNALPGSLDADATAAGVVPVSVPITLQKVGSTPFQADVQITMPYNSAVLGPKDTPIVSYWSSDLHEYEPNTVTSYDPVAGLVTFITSHFSTDVAFAIPGLGAGPFTSYSTGFDPGDDGFEIQNFTAAFPLALNGVSAVSNGACFGLTSYAAWYFRKWKANDPAFSDRLLIHYSQPNSFGLFPQEDAIARELVAATYLATLPDNPSNYLQADSDTLNTFYTAMKEKRPQLANIYTFNNNKFTNGHSVLLYDVNGSDTLAGAPAISFGVYDPNTPWPQPQPPRLYYSVATQTFVPWNSTSTGPTYNWIKASSFGQFFPESRLQELHDTAETGPSGSLFAPGITPQWAFNKLVALQSYSLTASPEFNSAVHPWSASLPGGYPYGTYGENGPDTIYTPPDGSSTWVVFQCTGCTAAISKLTPVTNPDGSPNACFDATKSTAYLHVLQNGAPLPVTPLDTNDSAIVSTNPIPAGTTSGQELLVFVSTNKCQYRPGAQLPLNPGGPPPEQADISYGYTAFYRATLATSPAPIVFVPPTILTFQYQGQPVRYKPGQEEGWEGGGVLPSSAITATFQLAIPAEFDLANYTGWLSIDHLEDQFVDPDHWLGLPYTVAWGPVTFTSPAGATIEVLSQVDSLDLSTTCSPTPNFYGSIYFDNGQPTGWDLISGNEGPFTCFIEIAFVNDPTTATQGDSVWLRANQYDTQGIVLVNHVPGTLTMQ